MNSQSFLFYFTGVIWNKSHILTVKIIWPMPIFDWRINIKIEASSAVFSPAMCGFFVNHFRQISAKHIIAENSSLVSKNLTPLVWIAIIMWPPVKSSPHTLFSKFILMSVIFYFDLRKYSHMMYGLCLYILFIYIF